MKTLKYLLLVACAIGGLMYAAGTLAFDEPVCIPSPCPALPPGFFEGKSVLKAGGLRAFPSGWSKGEADWKVSGRTGNGGADDPVIPK